MLRRHLSQRAGRLRRGRGRHRGRPGRGGGQWDAGDDQLQGVPPGRWELTLRKYLGKYVEIMGRLWEIPGKLWGNTREIPGKYHEQDLLHMAISCNFIGNIDDIETNMGKVWENDEPKGLNHRDFIAFVGIRNGTTCPKDFPRSPPFVSDMPSGNLTQLKEHQRFSEVNHLQTEHVPSLH